MSHLTLEALARLLDEPATAGERAHLAECVGCREELEGLRGQSDALAALPKMVPAPDAWPEIRGRLLEEGVVASPLVPGRLGRWRPGGGVKAAAAVLLFIGGGALGYGLRGADTVAGPAPVEMAAAREAAEPAGDALASTGAGLREVEEAQEAFLSALDQYMAATGSSPSDPATRLATLDNIVLTTAEALNEAPADPVINSFHLTALAQRNAMLRQIVTTSADPVY